MRGAGLLVGGATFRRQLRVDAAPVVRADDAREITAVLESVDEPRRRGGGEGCCARHLRHTEVEGAVLARQGVENRVLHDGQAVACDEFLLEAGLDVSVECGERAPARGADLDGGVSDTHAFSVRRLQ